MVTLSHLLLGATAALAAQSDDPRADEIARQFEAEVRPVLAEHCVSCHSGDDPKGGLRLDSLKALRDGAEHLGLFEAGDPDGSLMVEAVRYDDPFVAMPPSGKLPHDAIDAIERWIKAGAHLPSELSFDASDRLRWCFLPPAEDSISPQGDSDPIDVLIEKRLAEAGIEPSPAAENLAWLRRVTFDLTGLPPAPEEVDQFLRSEGENAKAAVVDRLLASPAFGERWGRRWLDLMRYAETKAHEFDFPIPNAWEYRDYVVRAFNRDVPYDRLVTELLAGDLVVEPRLDPTGTFDESPLGTGAWFLGEEVHSPVAPRGDQTDRVAHQVEVLSKAVLGLGVSCARCHDHKFDPISAADYHALAGYAISTAPRQLRYETDRANRALAAELRELEAAMGKEAKGTLAAALRNEAQDAQQIVKFLEAAADHESAAGTDAPSLRAFLDEASGPWAGDLLLEDFETGRFELGGLAPWTPEGEAFVAAPIAQSGVDSRQPDMQVRGQYGVNSYSGHAGDDNRDTSKSGDLPLGTLTSAAFTSRHPYLHFLMNGGDVEGTRVELLDAASGDVLASVRGPRSNRYAPRTFATEAYTGRSLAIRVVDDESGGWGQTGIDHIVASTRPDAPAAIEAALPLDTWRRLSALDPEEARAGWLSGLGDRSPQTLRAVLHGDDLLPDEEGSHATLPEVLVDYGTLGGSSWIVNGPAFGPGPLREGSLQFEEEGGALVIAGIASRPGAASNPAWTSLVVDPLSNTRRGGRLNWVQAGRTLASPSYVVRTGRVAHLVCGEGKLITPIASHKMISGPLHNGSIAHFDTGGRWEWVVQEIPSASGLHCHAEWSATGEGPLQIAWTCELEPGASPAPPRPWRPSPDAEDAAGPVPRLRSLLLEAAELLETGGVRGRVLEDDERAALLETAAFVGRSVDRVQAAVASTLEPHRPRFDALLARRQLRSRLAPAALDLEGRDEHLLIRGSWSTPGELIPRSGPAVLLRPGDGPPAEPVEGSGRLALAESLLSSEARLVQRVWANRVWKAMFGQGIVATPDDFGAMGASPTHPVLLDHLALSLEKDGWSTKRLIRRIALSRAYGRSSSPSFSAQELDPRGELLAHQRTRRLEAEEVRDALLASSGKLEHEAFGPPVPIHLTEFMTGRGRPGHSGPLDGNGRRSIYLEVRRNFPHPFLTVFDLPSPSTCHGRRTSANVPAQALAMLNDPFVEECATALAQLVSGEAASFEDRVTLIWRRAVGRAPTDPERSLAAALEAESDDPAASLVDIAHAVLNTKEFLFLR